MHTINVACRVYARRVVAGLILPVSLALPLPATWAQPVGLPELGDTAAVRLSPRIEQTLGDALMADGRRDPTYVDDPAINQYLSDMGRKMATHVSGVPSVNVFSIRDPSINAFAMPGGHIGIHSGLVVAAKTESELAGVLAHEIAHVSQRHVARGLAAQEQSSTMMLGVMLGALAAAALGAGSLAQGAAMFGQAAAVNSQLTFSREAEREADRVGLQIMRAAGYDPAGMAGMFSRLMQTARFNESGANAYASTHPLSVDRMSDLQNRIRAAGRVAHQDTATFWFVRARLRVLQAQGSRVLDPVASLRAEATQSNGARRAAAHYGVAYGLFTQGDRTGAAQALQEARVVGTRHAMLDQLAIELAIANNNTSEAAQLSSQAAKQWPNDRAVAITHARALQRAARHQEAAQFLAQATKRWSSAEPVLYRMAAESLTELGDAAASARNMAEYYVLIGALPAAVGQLQRARDLSRDFYEQSVLDARISEIQRRQEEERAMLAQFR